MNNITLLGRLTSAPVLSKAKTTDYVRYTLAVDQVRRDGVNFINCVSFGKLANAMARHCTKGQQVLINGRLSVSNNKGRNYYSVIANNVTFLAKPRGNGRSNEEKPAKKEELPF